jgi:hypothetical protein
MRFIGYMASGATACVLILIIILVAFTPEPCEHEEVTRYVFTSYDSTAHSDVCGYCKKCDKKLTTYSLIKGELVDKSYLQAIKEHSGGSEIVAGEYYTVTAIAPLGHYGYGKESVRLTCQVENENYIVRFSAEFQEEFMELIQSVEEGDEITFRGRFYDEGCGFTDCELIIE